MTGYPEFFFIVESIAVLSPDFRNGQWRPPRDPRRHVRYPQTAQAFFYDGLSTTALGAMTYLPGAAEYSIYTMYYGADRIWIAPQDASDLAGEVLSGSNDSEEEDLDSGGVRVVPVPWRNLSFQHFGDEQLNSISYVGYRQNQPRIANQHTSQTWPYHLLPPCYLEIPDPQARGQLVGELAVLIGLIAISLDPTTLQRMLPPVLSFSRNSLNLPTRWSVHPHNAGLAGHGWVEGRGLIVRVLYNPDTTAPGDLRAYEIGNHGPMLM